MSLKKILVIGPIQACFGSQNSIIKSMNFLKKLAQIEVLDPLMIMHECSNEEYYKLWANKLAHYRYDYDVFCGFAFGGVILQQCFLEIKHWNKSIILFSSPTIIDKALYDKLHKVITLCRSHQLEQALNALYHDVYFPSLPPANSIDWIDKTQAAQRMIFGLNRVLSTDSSPILAKDSIPHIHFIGELSNLVNKNHVLPTWNNSIITVPQAGMRVLEDNPFFCERILLEALADDIS